MESAGQAVVDRDYDKARDLYLAALPLAKTPEQRYAIHLARGGLFLLQHRNDEARKAYRAALAVKGVDPDKRCWVYMLIAITLDYTDNAAEIRAAYAQALKEDLSPPVRCAALAGFAGACEWEGDHATALQAYSDILKAKGADDRDRVRAHEAIGGIHIRQEKYDEALDDYVRALTLPDASIRLFEPICLGVGRALMGLGRHAEARELLLTCAENEHLPTQARWGAYSLVIDSLKEEGRAEEADQLEERKWELDSGNKLDWDLVPKAQSDYKAASLLAIGRFRLNEGDKDKAREAFRRLVEMEDAAAEDREKAHALLDSMN